MRAIWLMSHSGLTVAAAQRKWKTMYADASVRRDQVEATNENGEPIGRVPHRQVRVWYGWLEHNLPKTK